MESTIPLNKEYRLVATPASASFLTNNLSISSDGESFVYVNSYDGNPKAVIYGKDILEKGEI